MAVITLVSFLCPFTGTSPTTPTPTSTTMYEKMFVSTSSTRINALSVSLLIFFSFLTAFVSANTNEVSALLEFKKGIKVDPLKMVQSSWNDTILASDDSDTDACPSSFYGIYCDSSSHSVTAIVLDRLDLEGELKFFTLISLTSLQNLSLSGNKFTGRLVPALGSITSLQYIDLSDNEFYGPIPDRINDLWGLNYLNLSHNKFRGGYPNGLRNLQQLKVLDFHSNELWGDIRLFFSELPNAEFVDLSNNSFTGGLPSHVQNVSSLGNTLRHLNLSYNSLNGGFLSADTIALFNNLEVLDLGNNMITGQLPSFESLSNLKVLRLGNNQLYGKLPEGLLSAYVPLQHLDLSGNGFSGSIHGINSSTLSFLNLSSNTLTGSLPSSMGQCSTVDLSRNMISDDISVVMNWEANLELLDLSSNKLAGHIPNLASRFPELVTLKVSNNSLVGDLPADWGTFSKLDTVDLSINKFVGSIPPDLFAADLINLNLSGNYFTGRIPLQRSHRSELLVLSGGPRMEYLDLSNNWLTGWLPSDICDMAGLKLLNLARNELSGEILGGLDKLNGLILLDLSNNDFSGQIPENLPSSLMVLNVSYNNLSGPVPENLRRFPPSSFRPGNTLLQIGADEQSSAVPGHSKGAHSKSTARVAIILASIGAVVMIAFVLIAYYRSQIHAFHRRSKFGRESTGREVKVGRFARPSVFKFHKEPEPRQSSLSFSNDLLLTSNSRILSGQAEVVTDIVEHISEGASCSTSNSKLNHPDNLAVTLARKSSASSQLSMSPCFIEASEQHATLEVCSPDRLAGELFFLDASLVFTAEELSRAPAEVLGRSSHGTLYKATLDSGLMLAVKWLRVGLVKNKKDFAKEVKKISSMRHHNVVSLRAYYWGPREQERLVLSDFIHGDSLALHLYETTPRRYPLLSFSQRLKVAVDVARGLTFLHERGMAHGNLKPTNILLAGHDLGVYVSDYGLHRLMTPAGTAEQILNLGALGYCAPELASATRPASSFKADVYAFGVILMELLTRRSAGDIISGQSGAVDLPDWVRLCDQEGRRRDCIDRELSGGLEPSKAMDDMLVISLRCILPVNERPHMRLVYEDLCSIAA